MAAGLRFALNDGKTASSVTSYESVHWMRALRWILPLLLVAALRAAGPEIVFTELFVGSGAEIDAAFLADGARDLALEESSRIVERMAAVDGWAVHRDLLADPAASVGSLPSGRVYARGVVTRADVARLRYYGDYQVWTFSVGVRLEFFDIQSGQVYYGRSYLARVPVETAVEIDRGYRFERFREALGLALDECVARAGREYRPGRAEARVVAPDGPERVFLDAGSAKGLYPGLVLQARSGEARWLLKVLRAEEAFSQARVLAASGADPPPAGAVAEVEGLASASSGGPRLMVAGVVPGAPEAMDEWWDVDNASLGQWLHDGLVDAGRFDLLPPLLADSEGPSELASAFFRAQAVFSAFGDAKQDEVIGHRAFPDLLARGTVTHAARRRSQRLGYVAETLVLGLQLEIVDRASRQTLLSVSHEARRLEKQNETYRRADLAAAWRELAREAMAEAAAELAARWTPAAPESAVTGLDGEGRPRLAEAAPAGLRGALLRPEREIRGLDGKPLGQWRREYAIAEALPQGALRLVAADGTLPARGDVFAPTSRAPAGPRSRIRAVTVGGPKVREDFRPSEAMVAGWAQRELAGLGRFDLLPPENRAAEAAAAEVALASGEFEAVDLSEILSTDEPEPELLFDLRVGLARWEIEPGDYRNTVSFTTGVELSAFDAAGQPAPVFVDRDGAPTHQLKKVVTSPERQELSQGRVVQGPLEEEFPERLEQSLETCLRTLAADAAAKPKEAIR